MHTHIQDMSQSVMLGMVDFELLFAKSHAHVQGAPSDLHAQVYRPNTGRQDDMKWYDLESRYRWVKPEQIQQRWTDRVRRNACIPFSLRACL